MSKDKPNYAFIDSQNLNLGVQSLGWKLDYKKFRLYLKNKYDVQQVYLFIGKSAGNQELYVNPQPAGYNLVFKPTVAYFENGKKTMKGNVDAELVLYASAKLYEHYNKAVIVSGDGDFYCLAEYLDENKKLLRIITPNRRYSKLLSNYRRYITSLEPLQSRLDYHKGEKRNKKPTHAVGRNLRQSRQTSRSMRSVETLGKPRHGDSHINIAKNTQKVNKWGHK
ncbi:MAG TPA: NYN domain-containing protein [Candidatus Saccharibacteria bacterium]|nr:NYN domain-containing protein [Candidatus Saccharibacteria bacterium]